MTTKQNKTGPAPLETNVRIGSGWILLGRQRYQDLGSPERVTVRWAADTTHLLVERAPPDTGYTVVPQRSGTARIFVRPALDAAQASAGVYASRWDHDHGAVLICIPDDWRAPLRSPHVDGTNVPPAPLILSLPQVAELCDTPYPTVYTHVHAGHAHTLETIGNQRTAHYMTIEHLNAYRSWLGLDPLPREDIVAFFS